MRAPRPAPPDGGGADAGEEAVHLAAQRLGPAGQRLRRALDLRRRLAGAAGAFGDPAGMPPDLLGAGSGLGHGPADLPHRRRLLLGRGRDLRGQPVHPLDRPGDAADRLHRPGGLGLHGGDLLADLLGRPGGLPGQGLHLARYHREALAGLAGPGRLDRGVEGEEVGLAGDVADQPHHLADPLRRLGQSADRRVGGAGIGGGGAGDLRRFRDLPRHFGDAAGHLVDRGGSRLDMRAGLARGVGQRGGAGAAILRRALHGPGRPVEFGRRHGDDAQRLPRLGLEAADQALHPLGARLPRRLLRRHGGRHPVALRHRLAEALDRAGHDADLVAAGRPGHRAVPVAIRQRMHAGGQGAHRPGGAAGDQHHHGGGRQAERRRQGKPALQQRGLGPVPRRRGQAGLGGDIGVHLVLQRVAQPVHHPVHVAADDLHRAVALPRRQRVAHGGGVPLQLGMAGAVGRGHRALAGIAGLELADARLEIAELGLHLAPQGGTGGGIGGLDHHAVQVAADDLEMPLRPRQGDVARPPLLGDDAIGLVQAVRLGGLVQRGADRRGTEDPQHQEAAQRHGHRGRPGGKPLGHRPGHPGGRGRRG
nr:hypothetical protein [Paracraurococcus ruber]